jgi:hypothetical protein
MGDVTEAKITMWKLLVLYGRAGVAQSVSIVSGYGLDDRAIGVRSQAGAKDFSCSL